MDDEEAISGDYERSVVDGESGICTVRELHLIAIPCGLKWCKTAAMDAVGIEDGGLDEVGAATRRNPCALDYLGPASPKRPQPGTRRDPTQRRWVTHLIL